MLGAELSAKVQFLLNKGYLVGSTPTSPTKTLAIWGDVGLEAAII